MKNKFRKDEAITLVALVVTIVVLIILAGISIKLIAGEEGLIDKVKIASEKSEFEEEKIKLIIEDYKIEKLLKDIRI